MSETKLIVGEVKESDCSKCRWKCECVNVNKIPDKDCLVYKLDRRERSVNVRKESRD